MAVAWTSITNGQVAASAAITTSLMTALRDNPEGIAQRASGAPKIFGVPYDYQEITTDGDWTKPSNAETGDVVLIHCVGGGGGGAADTYAAGGGGGGGAFQRFNDIDDLPSTISFVIGAGAAASSGNGSNGGDTYVDETAPLLYYMRAYGGAGGDGSGSTGRNRSLGGGVTIGRVEAEFDTTHQENPQNGGYSGNDQVQQSQGQSSYSGGGGGGGSDGANRLGGGGCSAMAGSGGWAVSGGSTPGDGLFPGGGGGAAENANGGAGGDGVVRVWCIKEE